MSKGIAKEEEPPSAGVAPAESPAFASLRGVQWRVNLGILPRSSSIDDLRRVNADSRRRYAGLRRQLLVDPHVPRNGASNPLNLVMDNPLSQNPDSTWSRFFQNAELEKMVNQDLSRLYPEHESYFQMPGCQGMLRRILLLWCLRHPECSYRQGMHELLAPLLYVLHIDVEHLSEVRKLYEDQFIDKFDGFPFEENGDAYNFDFKKISDSLEDEIGCQGNTKKVCSLNDLDPEIQAIVLLSDAYGAEGELGIVLSEKFMEHDAYCMFDALMTGARGSVAMADFFSSTPAAEFQSGLPPVIEASAALYHLLSIVDSSLHTHLVELGVEPQYFALRWLRVLFGREFSLQNLLVIWDEIFAEDNSPLNKVSEDCDYFSFNLADSCRGGLISAMAVSMILYLRSSLLATETATYCLQRLLKFPESINLKKLIEKAKSLQILALESNKAPLSSAFGGVYKCTKSPTSSHSVPSGSGSPKTARSLLPDSYWEEKWRVMHKAEELRQNSLGKHTPSGKKRWAERMNFRPSRTESAPSSARNEKCKKEHHSVRRSFLEDLTKQLGLEDAAENGGCFETSNSEDHHSVEAQGDGQNSASKGSISTTEDRCENGSGAVVSEEKSFFPDPPTPPGCSINDHEIDSEKSSSTSNLSVDDNGDLWGRSPEDLQHRVSLPSDDVPRSPLHENESSGRTSSTKERRNLSGKFQWFRKFGRSNVSEETSDESGGTNETAKPPVHDSKRSTADSSVVDASCNSHPTSKGDTMDQNMMGTLKNLGQAMLDHIQVLESVFQQNQGQVGSLDNLSKNILVGKGQVTAITALKELRKMSNLLSEM
ncbi:Ypt/Rab-GAP domain of gyp1p superfamily protein isoform 3 [Hibiscus syriacus]|uniref:Ypt/Rab-GAP domain of gyp1p superfamily protein isoform 3 n=1 Tax=Hibiscus syriacus TaxID=106335 RepID=A0A6A3B7P5_HIBSY|nr:TBC1 domain family member 5 homolog A-like [Hibiscus syriacus]XP_038992922.1 TBC1 domain family member 5 homolog A-like [Hibiscus syriacus]KAE8711265.1 Ypt/Rab-GAP domain of gyp1p superfamily protein isoform 3 [Hibiscus syriacus]